MNVVCIIPARGGSKGIPGKNIMDFCGKPLVAWSILQARESPSVNHVYVSSDDQGILDVAIAHGASPLRRPPILSTDTATSEAALLHALGEVEKTTGSLPDLVVFLQATSPLRTSADIQGAIDIFLEKDVDSLFSASQLDDFLIWDRSTEELKSLTYNYRNRGRRQERKPVYLENGSIYLFRPAILRAFGNRLGGRIEMFLMPFWKSFEIDSVEDIPLCEFLMKTKIIL